MSAAYAHYRFASEVLPALDPAVRTQVSRFRGVFDTGAQGPDFFFYYNPLFPTVQRNLGTKFHSQTGTAFFASAVRRLKLNPSEVGTAYLYGVLAHYCLDREIHAYIHEKESEGCPFDHVEMESEFDRFLLTRDGKIPAHAQDLSRYVKLSRAECATVAELYPGAKARTVVVGVGNMRRLLKLFSSRNRKTAEMVMRLGGKTALQMLLPRTQAEGMEEIDRDMLAIYDHARTCYPVLAAQLTALKKTGAELGSEFDPVFG